jgi:hypothetical protein
MLCLPEQKGADVDSFGINIPKYMIIGENAFTGYETYAGKVRERFAESNAAVTSIIQINSIKYREILQAAEMAIA